MTQTVRLAALASMCCAVACVVDSEADKEATEAQTADTASGDSTVSTTSGSAGSGSSTTAAPQATSGSTEAASTSGSAPGSSGAPAGDEGSDDPFMDGSGDGSGTTDASSGSSGTGSDDGRVGVFIGQGDLGRSIVSFDDGRTWVENRSYDLEGADEACGMVQEGIHCYQDACSFWDTRDDRCEVSEPCDCNHTPGRALDIAAGHGMAVAAWGWGAPGSLKSTVDGVTWAVALPEVTFAGVAFGNGTFVANNRQPFVSADGVEWVEGGPIDFQNREGQTIYNPRTIGFANASDGVFVSGASSGGVGSDLMVSRDNGQSWTRPEGGWDCGGGFNGVAGGNDVIVLVRSESACRSTDGGESFTAVELQGAADVLFDGEQFVAWRGQERFTSSDGETWSSSALTVTGLREGHRFNLGSVARHPQTGTFVSVRTAWQAWYDDQDFYRSEDGIAWEVLPPENFEASHPIAAMTFAYLDDASL